MHALNISISTTKRLSYLNFSWWRHQMEKFSALLALCVGNSPVTREFPSQRPVTRSFDVFFGLRLIKRLSKQSSRRRWFETPLCSLWRHCNGTHVNTYINHKLVLLVRDATGVSSYGWVNFCWYVTAHTGFTKTISHCTIPLMINHINPLRSRTKWLPFCRQHFQNHFYNENCCIFIEVFFLRFQLTRSYQWFTGNMQWSKPVMANLRYMTPYDVTKAQWINTPADHVGKRY